MQTINIPATGKRPLITIDTVLSVAQDGDVPDKIFLHDTDMGGFNLKLPREAVRGGAAEHVGDEPVVLARDIECGCTIIWYGVLDNGKNGHGSMAAFGLDGDTKIFLDGTIESKARCAWRIYIEDGNLLIVRQHGNSTLNISYLVIKF